VHLRVEPPGSVPGDDVDDGGLGGGRRFFVIFARDKIDSGRVRDRVARRPQLQVERDSMPPQVPDPQERSDDVLGEGVEDEDAVGRGGGGVVAVGGGGVEEADERLCLFVVVVRREEGRKKRLREKLSNRWNRDAEFFFFFFSLLFSIFDASSACCA